MIRRLIIGSFLLMATVQSAHAEDVTPWIFTNAMPREGQTNGLTETRITPEGLLIRTSTDGFIAWPGKPVPGQVDVISLRVQSATPVQAYVMWQPTDGSDGLYQLPFDIPASDFTRTVDIIVGDYGFWDEDTEVIAFRFPAGTNLLLEEVQFRHWSWDEKLINAWKSFWTFDTFKAYSINFLWGPLLAGTDPGRAALYEGLPPTAWSVTRIFYALLILAVIVSLFFIRRSKARALGIVAGTFALLWLVFDVRMGIEILSYAKNDWDSFVLQPEDERELRTHGNYYMIQNQMMDIIKQHDSFVLLTTPIPVVFPNLRYAAYPTRMIPEGMHTSGATLWVAFESPGLDMDEQNRLIRRAGTGATVLTPPGQVVLWLNNQTFLFEATP